MEAESGMVAFVQGLRDAGLAVTLINKRHLRNSQNPLPVSKSSVETSTQMCVGRSQAAQVTDNHYTSSYQAAHCNAVPTSPPHRLPEFPPQRQEYDRNYGNFQVGYALGHVDSSPRTSHYRCGMMWQDRGSVCSGRTSPPSAQTDPFVHSLRRYPAPLSPENSVSSELVQRLLNYTQNKHMSKNSPSVSIRSLKDEMPTKDTTSTKNIQTYTRTKAESRDYGANTNNEIKFSFRKRGRSFASMSPYNVRTKSDHHNSTYDYFKETSPRRYSGRNPELRYLNDVKKCIRDTIKQMCDDRPLMCPQINSRYTHHKKEHHRRSSENEYPSKRCARQEDQELPSSSNRLAVFGQCQPPTMIPPCLGHPDMCCFCKKAPCVCTGPQEPQPSTESNELVYTYKADGKSGIENKIFDWLKDLPVRTDDSPENKNKREKIVEGLADKLKSLEGDDDYEEKAKEEIVKCIEKLPMWYPEGKNDQQMFKNQIAVDLFDKLKESDDVKNVIANWFDDVVFEDGSNVDKKELIDKICLRLKPTVGNSDAMTLVIENVLQELPIKNKNKVIDKLTDKLVNDLSKVDERGKRNSTDSMDADLELQIMEWLENSLELSVDEETNISMAKDLARKLNKAQIKDLRSKETHEKFKEEVTDWIDSILKHNGERLDSKTKSKLCNKLINKLSFPTEESENKNRTASLEEKNDFEHDIWEWLQDIADYPEKDKIELLKSARDLADKLQELDAEDADHDVVQSEIIDFLETISNKGVKISDNKVKLAKTLLKQIKTKPKQNKDISRLAEKDIKHQISEEIADLLSDFNINSEVKKELENSITQVLTDQIVRGIDNKKTKETIFHILQDADVSDENATYITDRLLVKNKEFSLSYRTQDSKVGISDYNLRKRRSMSPTEREEFEEQAENAVLKFIEDLTYYDDSPKALKIRKEATGILVHKLGEIMSDPDDTNKEESIIEELSQYLRKLSLVPDDSIEKMARQLTDRIQDIGFQASTPKKASFYPRRISPDFSLIYIDDKETSYKKNEIPSQIQSSEEVNFLKELTDLIKSWMDDLSIDLSATQDKGFRETMIQDLAGDILDRQKYLQLNPSTKSSDQEELEHLKYQVFRWINKLQDVDNMSSIIKKTETLMYKIKDIKVPQLLKNKETQELSVETIKDDITAWMDQIPQNHYASTDMNFIKQMVDELARKILKLRENNQVGQILTEITNWLRKMIRDASKQDLTSLADDLRTRLEQGVLTDATSILRQDSSQFVEENLMGGIQDWLKTIPLYQGRSSADRREYESLIPGLVKGLIQVFKTAQASTKDADQLFINEIVEHLKKFPIDSNFKSDEEFLHRTAAQLLHYLKGLQLFQDLSKRIDRSPDEYFESNLNDWFASLPIKRLDSKEKLDFYLLKKEFASTIKQIREQEPNNENKLRDEIKNYLLKFPIEEQKRQNVKFIDDKVEAMVRNLSAVPIELSLRSHSVDVPDRSLARSPALKKAADILFDNIESWCSNLPLKANTSEELERAKKAKQEISSKLIHKIGELNMNPEIFNDDFLYNDILEDEIENLLTDLSSEDIRNNLPNIKNDLMEKVKEARQKTQEEVAGQVYKQHLRDAISNTMPSQSMSEEGQASFEVLKDNLADAFINLHYVGGDENLKNKYKAKINDEVTKFCNDYLQKHPESPIDSKKLNQDLYNALKSVPVPKEETVRSEVELVKIKDEINEWVNELPLENQSATKKMQTNKIITVLSKKIHDIEKQKQIAPDRNYDEIMKKEVTKLVKKLPLNLTGSKTSNIVDKLISNLKNTEQSRKVSASTRHSIEPDSFNITPVEQEYTSERLQSYIPTCNEPSTSQYIVPPTTLSFEDLEQLEKVRERTPTPKLRYHPPSKDASVSPLPVDAGSQTEVRPWETYGKRLSQQTLGEQRPGQRSMQAVGSQAEVSPNVVVKEYYWGANPPASGPGLPCTFPSPIPSCITPQTPGLSQQTSPYSQQSQGLCSECPFISPRISGTSPSPQLGKTRKECEQPCFRRDMPEVSSEDHPEPCTSKSSRRPRARVTRLGSFDNMETCRSRHEWKIPEDDEFWADKGTLISDDDDVPILKERRKEEEKTRCRCRERILTNCSGRKRGRGCSSTCQSTENFGDLQKKRCTKCCGMRCPHPSYLYFRQ